MVPRSLTNAVRELGRLPGIGPKSAHRLAFHLALRPKREAHDLAQAIDAMAEGITFCPTCFNLMDAEQEVCAVCADATREGGLVCVVESPLDVIAIERSGQFQGRYHVLGGLLAIMRGVTPEMLRINELQARLDGSIQEVILALGDTPQGDTTADHLTPLLAERGVVVSRIASGLPVGGEMEWADETTIARAMKHRRRLEREPA